MRGSPEPRTASNQHVGAVENPSILSRGLPRGGPASVRGLPAPPAQVHSNAIGFPPTQRTTWQTRRLSSGGQTKAYQGSNRSGLADLAIPPNSREAETTTQPKEPLGQAQSGIQFASNSSKTTSPGDGTQTFSPFDALPPLSGASGVSGRGTQGDSFISRNTLGASSEQLPRPGGTFANVAHACQYRTQETPEQKAAREKQQAELKYSGELQIYAAGGNKVAPLMDSRARPAEYDPTTFSPAPLLANPNPPASEVNVYRRKHPVPTQRPFFELWRPLYTPGIYPPPPTWLGEYNPMMPHFVGFGDIRTGVGVHRLDSGEEFLWANQLNLNMDLRLTATERIHAFVSPFNSGNRNLGVRFGDNTQFINQTDFTFDSLFFEGDLGALAGGFNGHDAKFDLPFSFGLLPLFYQNGIWAADNVVGGAIALPARHFNPLKWSNFDATFFFALDKLDSPAFVGDNNAAEAFGTSWFIDAYDGHIEVNYAFVHDSRGEHRSYHNFGIGFTRRYFMRISNAIRFIANFDQSLPDEQRTAEGHLLLIENSLISQQPNTFVPYLNFFYGQGRVQSLGRDLVAGGILFQTGINFASDNLTNYPTLDDTAVNTSGAALGVNILGANFASQLVLEAAIVNAHGSAQFRNAAGDQVGLGVRYQKPLNHFMLIRTDQMVGFLQGERDIRGSRVELRWKF
ncbi:MAG TPA: hypothetical protein DDW52_06540 [Planctomycetaceae bacterium]|nr:hypothetical protein [Planctomycetaceae bacterium]